MQLSRTLIAATAVLLATPGALTAGEVRLYSWADYFGSKAVQQFTEETGTKVIYDVFDSNDLAETKLLAGKSGYDLVTPNVAPHFDRQLKAGLWASLDKSKLKNLGNADPTILTQISKIDADNAHSVPWMWGTTGIIFNTEKIKEIMPDAPLDSWRMLFDPKIVSKFEKCGVVMLDDGEQVLGSALIYLGKSINTATKADLDEAVALVKKIKPFVRKFHSSEYITGLATGEYCLALGFSGDAHIAAQRATEAGLKFTIGYRLPPAGALMYFDVFAIPADAPNPAAALSFIDFMLRPEIAAIAANETGFSTTNSAALKMIDAGVKGDPNLYPSADTIAKLTVPRTRDQKELRQWTIAWQTVKGER